MIFSKSLFSKGFFFEWYVLGFQSKDFSWRFCLGFFLEGSFPGVGGPIVSFWGSFTEDFFQICFLRHLFSEGFLLGLHWGDFFLWREGVGWIPGIFSKRLLPEIFSDGFLGAFLKGFSGFFHGFLLYGGVFVRTFFQVVFPVVGAARIFF